MVVEVRDILINMDNVSTLRKQEDSQGLRNRMLFEFVGRGSIVLDFPTLEERDKFYEDFKHGKFT